MRYYKFSTLTLSWSQSYLYSRTQQVVIDNSCSISGEVLCGVPHGSILDPLLFLLFINDLSLSLKDIPVSVDLFADDTTLYSTCTNLEKDEANLQKALDLVRSWCLENGMLKPRLHLPRSSYDFSVCDFLYDF